MNTATDSESSCSKCSNAILISREVAASGSEIFEIMLRYVVCVSNEIKYLNQNITMLSHHLTDCISPLRSIDGNNCHALILNLVLYVFPGRESVTTC